MVPHAEGASPLNLSDIPVPQYKYFPTHLLESRGPRQWARLRLLQACERLKIPNVQWPKFEAPELPRPQDYRYMVSSSPSLPAYLPLEETEAEWKARVHLSVNVFIGNELARFRDRLQTDVKSKYLTRIKKTRSTTPLDLRYEWAAKRLCYRMTFPELAREDAAKGYTEERIKQAVYEILKEAKLGMGRGK